LRAGEWRKLRNEELKNHYCSPNIFRVIKSRPKEVAGHIERMEEKRDVYRIFVGKPEGKRQLGRYGHKWEDNIKMDIQEVELRASIWLRIGTGGGIL
jgi:ribosomal protein L10